MEEVAAVIRICFFAVAVVVVVVVVVVEIEAVAAVMYFLDIVATLICSYLAYFLHLIDNLNYHCSSSIVCSL